MLKRIMIGVLVLLSLYVCPAAGDMGRITTSEATVREDSQKAIIFHNLDEEVLILGTDLRADKRTTVLRFIPFPSEPAVTLATGKPFQHLSDLIKKHKLAFVSQYKATGGVESAAPVEIKFSARLESHDMTVIRINEIKEFTKWVRAFLGSKNLSPGNDYHQVEEVASDYVKRGIRYFVFDLVEATPAAQSVKPVAYRFKSKRLYYPLKTSNTFGGKGEIDLIVISPGALCSPLESYYSGCFNNPDIRATTFAKISPVELENIFPESQTFFGRANIFMQLLRYDGMYEFQDDIFADIPGTPSPPIGQTDELSPYPVPPPSFPWGYPQDQGGIILKKPAIYLYPEEQTDINVSLEIDGKLTKTIPTYSTGWRVTAYSDGRIAGDYDYLFYEARLKTITLPRKGWIVEYKSLEKWFDIYLVKLGLNEKEIQGFKEYWLKKLPDSKYYDIRLLSNTFLQKHMGLQIEPAPDTLIRLIFHFTPVSEKMSLAEPVVTTPIREGFTVVEWGGVLRDQLR